MIWPLLLAILGLAGAFVAGAYAWFVLLHMMGSGVGDHLLRLGRFLALCIASLLLAAWAYENAGIWVADRRRRKARRCGLRKK